MKRLLIIATVIGTMFVVHASPAGAEPDSGPGNGTSATCSDGVNPPGGYETGPTTAFGPMKIGSQVGSDIAGGHPAYVDACLRLDVGTCVIPNPFGGCIYYQDFQYGSYSSYRDHLPGGCPAGNGIQVIYKNDPDSDAKVISDRNNCPYD